MQKSLRVVTGSGRGTTPKTTEPLLLRILHCQVCFLSQNAKLSHPKHHENNTEAEASIVIYFYEVTILGPLLSSSNYSKRTLWITRIFPPFDKNQHNYWWIWTTPGLVLLLPEMPAAAKSSNMGSPVQKKTRYLHGGNFMLVPMTYLTPGSNLHGVLAWLFAEWGEHKGQAGGSKEKLLGCTNEQQVKQA